MYLRPNLHTHTSSVNGFDTMREGRLPEVHAKATGSCYKVITPHLSSLTSVYIVIRNYTTPGCNKCFISVCSLQALNISYYINSQDTSMVSVVTWCPQFSILVFHTYPPTQSSHQPLQRNYQHWMTIMLYRCAFCYGNIGLHKTS